jgi:uncharacterized protein YeaO (DUF488 family)
MSIQIHRIYDEDAPQGYRVLVDRLWPRGIAKHDANLDGHWKDLAPSSDLRTWFDHDPEKWAEFRRKYLQELSRHKDVANDHLQEVTGNRVVLLYAARDKKHTHARVLKEYLEKLGGSDSK